LPQTKTRRAFTLIELLVVIAIIALLIGILLPALGRARDSARIAKCLANTRSMGLCMTLYANDSKGWFPVMQPSNVLTQMRDPNYIFSNQAVYGGLAGLFSLQQKGDGLNIATGGSAANDSTDGVAYQDGNNQPLLRAYLDGLGVLVCPSDKQDRAMTGSNAGNPVNYQGSGKNGYSQTSTIKIPKAPGNVTEVINYNISYLYIAGLKTDESGIIFPPPLIGDETDCYDIGVQSWYGSGSDYKVGQASGPGFYGKVDNHSDRGANFVFADGHSDFVKNADNIPNKFFVDKTAKENINLVQKNRSATIQTID
jgi:prepilin-type N-terminal cleavage/methylation domain-containing protein/prepilin-type processing-associated H-X9-DG protein